MHISTEKFITLVAVVIAASYASYGLEAVTPVHPVIRRGLQVAIMGAVCIWVLRSLQAL